MRIGIHTSRSGSLAKAAIRANELGANTFQIFSASPRIWRAVPTNAEEIRLFQKARAEFDLRPLSIHVNYLINLASLDPVIRAKSIEAFRGELERAAAIGAEYLVTHPGNHKSNSAEEGIAGFVLGLKDAAAGLKLGGLTVLIENTVGAGAQLGGKLSELRTMRDLAARVCDVPVGYCLDTCHLHAAGFDLATEPGLERAVEEMRTQLGMEHVRVIHANDSKGRCGSHLDRHANIGSGTIGLEGFARILCHPALRRKPFILETPADSEEDHRRDMETLKRLAIPEQSAGRKLRSGTMPRNRKN